MKINKMRYLKILSCHKTKDLELYTGQKGKRY